MTGRVWLDLDPRPGPENMGIDQTLLDLAVREGLSVLRFYRWAPFCLSFGRNEPAIRRYDRDRIAARGLATVRRPTGGRAVWHAGELTYAVAAPAVAFGALAAAYRTIHATIAEGLNQLGASARLADAAAPAGLDAGACFAAAVGGEVVVGGRKLVGSAQLREQGAFLQHGSILLDDDQAIISLLTRGDAAPSADMPLNRCLSAPVAAVAVANAVAAAAARSWAAGWAPLAGRDADRLIAAAAPAVARFASEAWTWRR